MKENIANLNNKNKMSLNKLKNNLNQIKIQKLKNKYQNKLKLIKN